VLVTFGAAAWRRPVGSQLAEWQIAAKNGEAAFAESHRQGHQQGRLTVRASTMR
jgi:hypothetical protein